MALPKIEHPMFRATLPSSGQEILYRPFTVKEEKILLMAEMSKNPEDIVLSVKQILANCIQTEIDVDNLALFDLEFLFIQLRAKSVGNIVQFTIMDAEDQKTVDVEVDLEDVKVGIPEGHTNIVHLDETTIMELKYPTVNDLQALVKFDKNDPDQVTKMVAKHIAKVYDDEKIYDLSEETEESLCDWLDSFERPTMIQIESFWKTMPSLRYTIKYKNSLGHERSLELVGLLDFFR